jgi:acetyl-CoA carboxylase beta subunit
VPGVEVKLVQDDSTGGKTEIRFRGPNVTPGYWRNPEQTAKAFDDEGFYRTGDAVRWVDPADHRRGLFFDGRTAEDFKLSTGTFVSVGPLRARIVAAGDPCVQDAVITGINRDEVGALIVARLDGLRVAVGAMDSQFIMASMGSALGEKFSRLCDDAIRELTPVIVFAASGGARMQEGILALMQMAKTSGAVLRLNQAGIPYIVVLTDPTSGGVYASFASLGDIILAEPKAYVGFAGARLIEGALKVKLPSGFQTSEYQFENGHIDQIVKREDLRDVMSKLVRFLHPAPDTCPLVLATPRAAAALSPTPVVA